MPTFDNYAGQEIASGIRPNGPLIAFEGTADRTVLANLATINGLAPKLGKVLMRETRVFDNPVERIFRKTDLPYGAGYEDFAFKAGAVNKKGDGTCVPRGNVAGESQINLINLAWSFDIMLWDYEINKAVLTPEEAGQYFANKTRTLRKGFSKLKYSAEVQLLSDVIDGTRAITSTDQSDGNGNSVTYSPTITGYAGQVEDSQIVLPSLVQGTIPTFTSPSDALDLVKMLENAAAEMKEEGTAYSALGIETFTLNRPWLIMETKTLNALDNAWAMDGNSKIIPSKTAREFMSRFADIVEIGNFADLPTNSNYANHRLAAVLLDKDSATEAVSWSNEEAQRCAKQRATGVNFAGESAISIFRGNPAYALLTNLQ